MPHGKTACLSCGLAILIFASLTLNLEAATDVFYRQSHVDPKNKVESLLLAAMFGGPRDAARLRAALVSDPDRNESQAEAWSFLCRDSYHRGDYPLAIADCTSAIAIDPADRWGAKGALTMAQLLKETPAPLLAGTGARVALTADGRFPVIAGDEQIAALADTGAQICVMMQSIAEKIGVHILGDSEEVGTTTKAVSGKIGVIARARIGDSELRNLPVLVLPDAALTYDEGKLQFPLILSLYAMEQFGRVAWLDHGKILAFGDAAPSVATNAEPVFWHRLGVGISIDGAGGRRSAHYDTGSNKTYLYSQGLVITSKAERASVRPAERKVGGVGGVIVEKIRRLPRLTARIGGEELALTNVDVVPSPKESDAARVGSDICRQNSEVVLDFERMLFSVKR